MYSFNESWGCVLPALRMKLDQFVMLLPNDHECLPFLISKARIALYINIGQIRVVVLPASGSQFEPKSCEKHCHHMPQVDNILYPIHVDCATLIRFLG